MKKLTTITILALAIFTQASAQKKTNKPENQKMAKTHAEDSRQTLDTPDSVAADHYVFKLSDKVIRKRVSFHTKYGIMLSADLYLPKSLDTTVKSAALIVGAPYGGVKEQGPGIYAQNMAERGFVALTFDPSYNGYSGGEPRHISSPDVFVEDFSAAVDYIGTRSFVDRNKIGVVGLCSSGGFALSAAQVDRRIKAIATSAMYDIARVKREGFMGSATEESRNKYLDEIGEQRWREYEGAPVKMTPRGAPLTVDANTDTISHEWYEYYSQPRGQHPHALTSFTEVSEASFINFPLLTYISSISPRPILFITGTRAHSRYMSEDAYKLAGQPKELYVVPGARHIDLYDDVKMIPFDKLESFFKQYLK